MVAVLLANYSNELFTVVGALCDTAQKMGGVGVESMPTDVSVEVAQHVVEAPQARRLPIGVGLTIGACASLALWAGIGLGLRALFS